LTEDIVFRIQSDHLDTGELHVKARTNAELIEDVTAHQEAGIFHTLTCGNDSQHRPLQAEVRNGEVILFCPDCDYVQTHIPGLPTAAETADMLDAYNQLFKAMREA
jgi:hypothetical protein